MSLFGVRRSVRQKKRFVPQCEPLEYRWCPSAYIQEVGHTLIVHGDTHASDSIVVTDDGKGDVSATISNAKGNSVSGAGSGIDHIKVETLNGNDSVNYSLSAALGQNEWLEIQLGKGNDQVTLDATAGVTNAKLGIDVDGGKGPDQLTANFGSLSTAKVALFANLGRGKDQATLNFAAITGSQVNAEVHTGGSSDTVTTNFNADITNSTVYSRSYLGRGADTFTANVAGNLVGTSALIMKVYGDAGKDTISVNAPNTNIDAGSRLVLDLYGGRGADSISANYQGVDNGTLRVVEHGGPGNDTVSENLTLNQGSTGNVIARVYGGAGNDDETLNVFDNSGGKLADLDAVIYAILGHNTVHHTPNVKVITK
jgi:hypothetical protein